MTYDDTRPLTTERVLNELEQRSRNLDDALSEFRKATSEHALAEWEYRRAQAVEFLKADGAMELRKRQMDNETNEERRRCYEARAAKEIADRAFRAAERQQEIWRTIGASVRSEIELARG